MKYDEQILRDLISIYEKRNANSSDFKQSIRIKLTKDKYPKYFDDVIGYDEAISKLDKKGYIKIKKIPHDTVVESISLNLDKVDEIEQLLGIDGVSKNRDRLLNELNKYDDKRIVDLKNIILERIDKNKSIKQYLDDNFIDAIKAVHYIENLDHDVYERNASNYIYNDSKKLASLKTTLNSIYNSDNILEESGIISVTPYLYVKGEGTIKINNQTIDLASLKTSIGVPIDNVDIINFENIKKVTTIENLTTFYDYKSDGLIIYLGGFSTRSQKKILNKIKDRCNNFYHFGDIDYGGFTILNDLMEYLDLDIKAVNMDLDTLLSNIKYVQPFDDNKYADKLKNLLTKPRLVKYYDVIEYLINNKVWLEQESFYNN